MVAVAAVVAVVREKEFHLGDVLSIITSRLVSPRHMAGVSAILSFMVGGSVFDASLPDVRDMCTPHLLEQFPQLAAPEMDSAVAELDETLETASGNAEKKGIVADWLAKQVAKYGEMFVVKSLPRS